MPHPIPGRPPARLSLLRSLIRIFFADYLRLVEPDSAEHLRPEEASFLIPRRDLYGWNEEDEPGVVAEVPTRRDGRVTVLVQIEPEPCPPAEISDRIGGYFLDLEIRYCQPVLLSVVYLRGGRPGVHLESAAVGKVGGVEVLRMFYTAFGLSGARAEYYLDRPEPLAWVLAALMRPLRLSPSEHRRACLDRIAGAALDDKVRSLLSRSAEAFLDSGVDACIHHRV